MVSESIESDGQPIPAEEVEARYDRLRQRNYVDHKRRCSHKQRGGRKQRAGREGTFIYIGFSACLLLLAVILDCYLSLPNERLTFEGGIEFFGGLIIIFALSFVIFCVAFAMTTITCVYQEQLSVIHKCLGFAPILLFFLLLVIWFGSHLL